MSNQAVGNVYQTIIEEVVNSSRVDFEENGVEESVLEELRLGWQQKLSQLDVAQFPWDPKPDPPPQQAPSAAVATGAPTGAAPVANQPGPSHSQATFSPQLPHANGGPAVQPTIKQEPGLRDDGDVKIKQEPGHASYGFNGLDDKNNVAANRAAQLVQQTFGNRGTGSINAIQDNLGQHQQAPAQQEGYPQQIPPAMPQQQQGGLPHYPSVQNAQTDGAADEEDFEAVLMRRGAAGELQELGRVEIDSLLHQHIAANAKSMEGGGLMVPLREATKHKSKRSYTRRERATGPYDGPDDDEDIEDDEDAINSDLDDSDEGLAEDDVEDEGLGSIMLCMYDKVQRVKNKWKCTLKDGVLTVNGKEYVFHKAQGEFEW